MTTTCSTRLAAATLLSLGLTMSAHAASVTRGPYLQTPTTSSMIVRWRTDTPTNSRVAYGAAVGSLTSNADDLTLTTEHIVTVSGLSPDTKYYYSIGSVAGAFVGDDANHFLRTNPTPGTVQPVRIFAPGDGGFLNDPGNPGFSAHAQAVRNAYYAYTAGTPTNLFMPLGDNAYLFATDVQMQQAVFDGFASLLRATPLLPIYGNHEQLSSSTMTQTGPFFDNFSMPTAGQSGGVASGSETYFSIDYANVHIIVLDTERARAADSGAMMAWLNADLAAANADWTIAMWHRPPYSRGLFHNSDTEAEEAWTRQNILPILESYGVDAVFNGHSHSYERSYLLDGHYGLASTFSAAFQRDPGDGNPTGDGSYRKSSTGHTANSGAVYVVSGSSSEVRNSTLNHPAHKVGLLLYGALVIDINGNTLTSQFLDENGVVQDRFQIVKGNGCPTSPAPSCSAGAKGGITIKNNADNTKDKMTWKWQNGTLSAGLGDPSAQTDFAVCIYDQNGKLTGGQVPHGTAYWTVNSKQMQYKNQLGSNAGITKLQIKPNVIATKAKMLVKAKGAAMSLGTLPGTFPITAQLINLDNNQCWQSTFPVVKKNDGVTLAAKIP